MNTDNWVEYGLMIATIVILVVVGITIFAPGLFH